MTMQETQAQTLKRPHKFWLDDETSASLDEYCERHALSRSAALRVIVRRMINADAGGRNGHAP